MPWFRMLTAAPLRAMIVRGSDLGRDRDDSRRHRSDCRRAGGRNRDARSALGGAESGSREGSGDREAQEAGRQKTKKAVKKSLPGARTQGLSKPPSPPKIKVGNCARSPKRGRPTAFKCRWKVGGELSGRVPVRCTGKATYKVRKKKVTKVSPCKNREERQAPLLAAPHDVLFGYFEDFTTHGNLFGELGASRSNTLLEGIAWKVLQPNPGAPPRRGTGRPYDSVYAAGACNRRPAGVDVYGRPLLGGAEPV